MSNNCDNCVFGDSVANPNERLAKVETKVDHIETKVDRIESGMDKMTESLTGINSAVTKLSSIAESNQKMEPRVKALEEKLWRMGGVMTALLFALTFFGDKIKGFFG